MLPSLGLALTGRRSAGGVALASVVDTFDRADGAVGTASDGGVWTVLGVGANVASNVARSAGSTGKVVRNLTRSDNFTLSCDMNTGGSSYPLLMYRGDGTANNFLGVGVNTQLGLELFSVVGGSFTLLASSANNVLVSVTTATVALVIAGTSVTAKVNGSTVVSTTTSALQTNTWVGFGCDDTITRFDNFSAV